MRLPSRSADRGFVLLVTIVLLAILLGLVVALASSISLSQREASVQRDAHAARQSALVGMRIALGELQAAAGPDQRVTATAAILGDSGNAYASEAAPAPGRTTWTGVWKSNTTEAPDAEAAQYSPAEPDSKALAAWLVSATDADGNFALPTSLEDVTESKALNDPVTLLRSSDGTATMEAGKVLLEEAPSGSRYFAFGVEDEGVKVDLSWNETPGSATTPERAQAIRLSAAPGPDYAALNGANGPFDTTAHPISYPLTIDESSSPFLADAIEPMRDPADLQVLMEADPAWLEDAHGDITWGSRGVLCDVKRGGLRRDLSLAFEMDGTADTTRTSQPTLFNQQDGEFVGGNDHLQPLFPYPGITPEELKGSGQAPGMPVKERHLYRVTYDDGSPFSDQLTRFQMDWRGPQPNSVIRGPNWWALRDFYNLYKRLEGPTGSLTLNARSYYPNRSADNINGYHKTYRHLSQPRSPWSPGYWDDEVTQIGDYVFHPARANYTPVLMGMIALYSMKVTNYDAVTKEGDLTLAIDPMIYLWNPFNVTLHADRYAIALQRGHGGKISFVVEKADGSSQKYGPAKTDLFIKEKMRAAGEGLSGNLTYLVSDLTMEPGEVVIVSPGLGAGTSANELHDEASPGTNLTDSSGIEVTQMPLDTGSGNLQWQQKVKVGPGDTVRCLYEIIYHHSSNLTGSAEHYWMASFLPNDKNIAADKLVNADTDAERVQIIGGNLAAKTNDGCNEYFIPKTNSISGWPEDKWPKIQLGDPLANGKFFFGINSHLLKPTQYTKVDGSPMPNQNAVEVFSQFNPFRTGTFVSGHRTNRINETYCSLSMPGSVNTYIQEIGIQFPPTVTGRRGYWGQTMNGVGGSTSVPFISIHSAPLLSLADFANGNFSLRAQDPYKQVGNSHANIYVPGDTLYAQTGESARPVTASDSCWLINDALFDRYYLSGIAPDFSIDSGGYTATGSISETLTEFFGNDPLGARASPVLRPYLPSGKTAGEIVTELTPGTDSGDGYRKLGAYCLIEGAFNVNSTSTAAWEALLRANRNLPVLDSSGGEHLADNPEDGGTPFPNGSLPPAPGDGAQPGWSGFSRLTDAQISTLADHIVEEVRARGPFMSLSDFVNRQLSDDTDLNAAGALQAALDKSGALSATKGAAGGTTPVDPAQNSYNGKPLFPGDADLSARLTTEGIAGDIRQADLLRPLAPRLSARSDTFRIRAYGEVRSKDGSRVVSRATCEAVVQRIPEYFDAGGDEPWDEGLEIDSEENRQFGRRFKIVQFRWLAPDES